MTDDKVSAQDNVIVAKIKAEIAEQAHNSRVQKESFRLLAALKSAVRIADEAREEWDKAPQGMRAGKILIALAGGCKGYRADIDEIHAAILAVEGVYND